MKKQKPRKRKPQKNTDTNTDQKQSIFSTEQSQTSSSSDILHKKPAEQALQDTPRNINWQQERYMNIAVTDPSVNTEAAIRKAQSGQSQDISFSEYLTLPVQCDLDLVRKSHIMFATPCYGGMIGAQYLRSWTQTMTLFNAVGMKYSMITIDNESLVTRARNTLVAYFLADPSATHLMFIDADIGWTSQDIIRMMSYDQDVIVGAYPKKGIKYPDIKSAVKNNPDILPEHLEWHSSNYVVNMAWETVDGQTRARVDDKGNLQVLDAGTGFMIIRRSVIERIIEAQPELKYVNDMPLPEQVKKHSYSIFDTIHDPETNRYLSEDYTFCRRWQKLGGEIWLDPRTRLDHWGGHCYKGNITKIFDPNSKAQVNNKRP